MAIILGEENPGFNLWTSAHGFVHISLTQSKLWRIFWITLLTVLTISLVSCAIAHFYLVLTLGVRSRVTLESASKSFWPTIIICDRQFFSRNKMNAIAQMTPSHASILSWSIDPKLARPEVTNDSLYPQLLADLKTILARPELNQVRYNGNTPIPGGPIEMLLRDMAPNCTQLILSCIIGRETLNGRDCCSKIFDLNPYFTFAGTCYSTRGALTRREVSGIGEGDSFSITTLHDSGNTFDEKFSPASIFGMKGLKFAVVDDHITVPAAVLTKSRSIDPVTSTAIGLRRLKVDSTDLSWTVTGQQHCEPAGERDPIVIDADLNYGIDYRYGYTKEACQITTKQEMLAREMFLCTFNPLPGDTMGRCGANQSISYYQSFISANTASSSGISIFTIDSKAGLRPRYEKKCPANCIDDRYFMTQSTSPITPVQITALQSQISSSGQAFPGTIPDPIILKLYMSSREYQLVQNYPEPGMKFLAQLGGLMVFFLGISIISLIECIAYCIFCGFRCITNETEQENAIKQKRPSIAH